MFAALCAGLSALFLLRSTWLTEAFSDVLSALCLFAPFEEFVNNSFSIPTLVYYLTTAVLFLFFKAQGIEKIYNFDPHLDNAGADTLVNINDKNNAVDAFAKRFQQTIDEFGLTDLQSKNTANVVDLPTLFTYNKDNTGDKVLASTANVADRAELEQVIRDSYASGYTDDLILQDRVPGNDEYMRVLTSYSDRDG